MNKPELWRLISSNLAFTSAGAILPSRRNLSAIKKRKRKGGRARRIRAYSAGELVFGFGLLYYFRTVERNFGTGKYTVRQGGGTIKKHHPERPAFTSFSGRRPDELVNAASSVPSTPRRYVTSFQAYAFVVSTVAAILQLVISKAVMASPVRNALYDDVETTMHMSSQS